MCCHLCRYYLVEPPGEGRFLLSNDLLRFDHPALFGDQLAQSPEPYETPERPHYSIHAPLHYTLTGYRPVRIVVLDPGLLGFDTYPCHPANVTR